MGWTGVSAINVPVEYLVGLRPQEDQLGWDVRLCERHGVLRYPQGATNSVDLVCDSRASAAAPPTLHVTTREPPRLVVRCAGTTQVHDLAAGSHTLRG